MLTVIGAVLLVDGAVMGFDLFGLGTKWRNYGMRFYDRRGGPGAYDRNTRRFRITYRLVAGLGLFLLVAGLLESL